MRKARSAFQYFPDAASARTLCHSAFGGPWPGMTSDELDEARKLLFEHAEFCSVEILAFSLRPRSFDLLLEVSSGLKLSKKEMLSRMESNFDPLYVDTVRQKLKSNDPEAWASLSRNFGSISNFLKRFKQVLARNYHRAHQTSGTLWESRYDSAYVEAGHASRVVAAWIDHGCARETAGISPEDSPHCTIGAAISRNKSAQEMIRNMVPDGSHAAWPDLRKAWRNFISDGPEEPKIRTSNLNRTPPLTRAELMLHPVPHFTTGLAVGSHDFIQRLFVHNRDFFSDGRGSGARFITGQNDPDLFTLRDKGDLRKPPRSNRSRHSI